MPDRATAVREVHFPESWASLEAARRRLAFEEMFLMQLGAQREKRARQQKAAETIPFDQPAARAFVSALPFKLTDAQRVAAWQILQDLSRPMPMNRRLAANALSTKPSTLSSLPISRRSR